LSHRVGVLIPLASLMKACGVSLRMAWLISVFVMPNGVAVSPRWQGAGSREQGVKAFTGSLPPFRGQRLGKRQLELADEVQEVFKFGGDGFCIANDLDEEGFFRVADGRDD